MQASGEIGSRVTLLPQSVDLQRSRSTQGIPPSPQNRAPRQSLCKLHRDLPFQRFCLLHPLLLLKSPWLLRTLQSLLPRLDLSKLGPAGGPTRYHVI